MKRNLKIAVSSLLTAAMVLSMTACDQSTGGNVEITTNADFVPLQEYIATVKDDFVNGLSGTSNAEVGDPGQRVKLHHGGRAFDGMHDPENFVDIILRECIFLFRVKNNALQLLKKRVGFIDVHIQDIIVAHENTTLSAFFITIDLLR